MGAANKNFNLEEIARTLAGVVSKIFNTMNQSTQLTLRDNVDIKKKNIIEYEGKLRVSGIDLFNMATYLSAVTFYLSEKDKAEGKAVGAIILYIIKEKAAVLCKAMGYRDFDDEDDESMMKPCGEWCRTIGENFVKELTNSGYGQLIASEPENDINTFILGLNFSKDQFDQYQLDFFAREKGEKICTMDITMAALPKK